MVLFQLRGSSKQQHLLRGKNQRDKTKLEKVKYLFICDFYLIGLVISKHEEDERLSVAAAHTDSLYPVSVCKYVDLARFFLHNLPGRLII